MHGYVIADVFTDTPLEGNQVAVFLDAAGLDEAQMQRTAREMNLSETVFVLSRAGADAELRIFTPATEMPFAGHPILGTAFVLGSEIDEDVVRLRVPAGDVPVTLTREGDRIVFGEMEQPIPTWQPFTGERELFAALGVEGSELPLEAYDNGPTHLCVALRDEEAVAALRPDMGALAALGALNVSCFAGAGRRFKTRMFAPGLGVAEDPATGSAAGPLALHLARHGRIGFGEGIEIRQGVEIKRPSVLHARVDGSPEEIERVAVGGAAVVVARGEYRLG
ncbi:MAG TPA: PhzF family phenazine biosynthesis protein [Solirubrobacteraceae bacterium]